MKWIARAGTTRYSASELVSESAGVTVPATEPDGQQPVEEKERNLLLGSLQSGSVGQSDDQLGSPLPEFTSGDNVTESQVTENFQVLVKKRGEEQFSDSPYSPKTKPKKKNQRKKRRSLGQQLVEVNERVQKQPLRRGRLIRQ